MMMISTLEMCETIAWRHNMAALKYSDSGFNWNLGFVHTEQLPNGSGPGPDQTRSVQVGAFL